MKKRLSTVRREIKNRDYTEEEVLVREATSNSEEMPSAVLLDKIGKVMLKLPTYIDAFEMLWRRLCHLEYRKHVYKSLCVLDHLMRVNPPNSTVQLALVVDIRDRWADISRLSGLKLEALGSDTGQIRSLALRICQFVVEYEKSPNFVVNRERLRVKRKQTVIEPREQRHIEEADSKWTCVTCGFANSSRLHTCIMCEQQRDNNNSMLKTLSSPSCSSSASFSSPSASSLASSSSPASQWWWACARCSFVNTRAGYTNTCEMCRNPRTVKIIGDNYKSNHDYKINSDISSLSTPAPAVVLRPPRPVWQCTWCTFMNSRLASEPCEACSKTSAQILAEAEHDAANSKLIQQKIREAITEQETYEQTVRKLSQELVNAERSLKEAQDLQRRLTQQERETNEVRNAVRKQAIEQAKQREACGVDIAQRARGEQGRRDRERGRGGGGGGGVLGGERDILGMGERDREEKERSLYNSNSKSKIESDINILREKIELEKQKQQQQQQALLSSSSSSSSSLSSSSSSSLSSAAASSSSSSSKERNDIEAIKQAAKDRIANLKQKQEGGGGGWNCSFCHFSNPATTTQCEVCKQTQAWVCTYCQTSNTNSSTTCKQCNRESGSAKVVMHYYTPPEDAQQPKGWLCPFCRTVNNQNTEVCKTCNHRKDLAPPAYHHLTPPTTFKDIHSGNGNSGSTTASSHTSSSFTVEHPPSSSLPSLLVSSSPFQPTKRAASPPSSSSPSPYDPFASISTHTATATTTTTSSVYHSSPLSFTRATVPPQSSSSVINFASPSLPHKTDDRYNEEEEEGHVGTFQRQMSALSSFDSFFEDDAEEEGRQSFASPLASNSMYNNNNNHSNNKYNSPDRDPAAIFEQLSSGSMHGSPSIPEKPTFEQPGSESPHDLSALWTCSQCAYINDRGKAICDVCNQPRSKANAVYREY